jgi:hypothetical protein
MKPLIPRTVRRAAMLLPALSLMVAPLAAQAAQREDPTQESQGAERFGEIGVEGPAGAITEVNMGPVGMNLFKQQERPQNVTGTRVLSGRVIEQQGQTLYVEHDGVVVPLDLSALRITQQPRPGQEIVATYSVNDTRNVALSLAGEVAEAQ